MGVRSILNEFKFAFNHYRSQLRRYSKRLLKQLLSNRTKLSTKLDFYTIQLQDRYFLQKKTCIVILNLL